MEGVSGNQGSAAALVVGILLATLACAAGPTLGNGRYRDGKGGWEIADLAALDGRWKRAEVDGAALVFHGPDRMSISLLTRCRPGRGDARVLARNLLIGLEERHIKFQGEVDVSGRGGWRQRVSARTESGSLQLHTVTLRVEDCTYDWILMAPGKLDGAEALFDAWWSSFRLATATAEGSS